MSYDLFVLSSKSIDELKSICQVAGLSIDSLDKRILINTIIRGFVDNQKLPALIPITIDRNNKEQLSFISMAREMLKTVEKQIVKFPSLNGYYEQNTEKVECSNLFLNMLLENNMLSPQSHQKDILKNISNYKTYFVLRYTKGKSFVMLYVEE